MPAEDRRTTLCEQDPPVVTGIDFVQVVDPAVQTVLRIFFIIDPDEVQPSMVPSPPPVDVSPDLVTIESISGGESLAEVPVIRATYLEVALDGEFRTVLEVETAEPGDFSIYRLTVHHAQVDRFFNGVEFSFKQGCPTDLDCEPKEECPPEELVDFPVDYLARDFVSLRNALLDFAAQRYPSWSEKIEADAGVMLAEVMAALGDEVAYIQDRHAREAYLETASQRRSLRWHTRLVDYAIHDGLSAATVLTLSVDPAAGGDHIEAGARAWARLQGEAVIPFEVGEGLADQRAGRRFWVHSAWNDMPAHVPDGSEPCLPVGATELFLVGELPLAGQLPPGDPTPPEKFWVGRWMVLKSDPEDASLPRRRHLVRLEEVEITEDPLCLEGGSPISITRIRWADEQALPFELCLRETVVRGNVVPVTAGETFAEHFVIDANDDLASSADVPSAVERQGACNELTGERSPVFLHTMVETEGFGLGWVGELRRAEPEVEVQQVVAASLDPEVPPRYWEYRRSLLDSTGLDENFTLDDGSWWRVIGFQRQGEIIEHRDYASGDGFSVRFGDGEFGQVPADGTVFRVKYRTGPGTQANVARDSITLLIDPRSGLPSALTPTVEAVTNPFEVTTGVDPEDAEVIRQLAPEAFKALTFRAVRDEDYEEIAERLPWVQRAGATARWTGSWLSEFATADPLGSFALSAERRAELEATLDCVRQVGREVWVRDPRFVSLDLLIRICVEPFAYPGQVKERVIEALTGGPGSFFDPDHFTFGTPLGRAELEAKVQAVPGVRGVEEIYLRARGVTPMQEMTEMIYRVGDDQILRLQNDPRFPERGSLAVYTRGEVGP